MKFVSYLKSSEPFSKRSNTLISWGILLSWLAIVIGVSFFHEMWKDEVRALSLAISPDFLSGLPTELKNEGHPIVWYLLLRWGFQISQSTAVLQIMSIAVAFISVFLFFRYAPFVVWFKICFLITFLPFYEYSVVARNYGISMLFFFLFASFYPQRRKKAVGLAIILAVLANTNIHSSILVIFLALFWLYDIILRDEAIVGFKDKMRLAVSFLMVFGAVVFAVVTVLPDQTSIFYKGPAFQVKQIISVLFVNMLHPGNHYDVIFYGVPPWGRDLLVWIICLGLLSHPAKAIVVAAGIVAMGVFFSVGYGGSLRHQGVVFMYILTIYWIAMQSASNKMGEWKESGLNIVVHLVFPAIFLIHIAGSIQKIHRDITQEMSSSKAFGKLINENSSLKDAIIIGEPDIRLESLPYYVSNKIYLPREGRFQNFVRLTNQNKQVLSLDELLHTAKSIKQREDKPVVIALGHFDLSFQNSQQQRTDGYDKKFTWTEQELHGFIDSTIKIAEFKQDVTNERYEIYLLKQ